jgi:hypothetical protein
MCESFPDLDARNQSTSPGLLIGRTSAGFASMLPMGEGILISGWTFRDRGRE